MREQLLSLILENLQDANSHSSPMDTHELLFLLQLILGTTKGFSKSFWLIADGFTQIFCFYKPLKTLH